MVWVSSFEKITFDLYGIEHRTNDTFVSFIVIAQLALLYHPQMSRDYGIKYGFVCHGLFEPMQLKDTFLSRFIFYPSRLLFKFDCWLSLPNVMGGIPPPSRGIVGKNWSTQSKE